jgi:holliday junction DNA helicase RuvA
MISYLIGKPILHKNHLTILVGGVGYKVNISNKTFQLAQQKATLSLEIELHIYTHVKEEAFELFGFESEQDLEIFQLALSVSGVGPSIALSLTNAGTDKIIDAVQNANVTFFTSIPRVGKKLAQKIIIDLKSKLGSLKELNLAPMSSQNQDIFDALTALGFDEVKIDSALNEIAKSPKELTLQESIQMAIKFIGAK